MKRNNSVLPLSAMLLISSFLLSSRVSAAGTTPDPFTFNSLNGVPLNTLLYSNIVTITGLDAAAPISITGGQYSINGGPFTSAPGTVANGNTVAVDITSAGAYSTTSTATLTIDTVSSSYTVVTDPNDITPDQFAFTPQSNAAVDTVVESNPITISGLAAPTFATITGGEYSINGSPFTSIGGMINNGDVIKVRLTSSATPGTLSWATFSAHWVYADFFVQTAGAANPTAFSFTPQTGVAANTQVVSDPITVAGLTGSAAVSITGGEYSVNGGPFRSTATNILNDDVITVRQTSSPTPATQTKATLTIGGTSADFAVTTAAVDPVGAFSFTPQTGVALSTTATSDAITVSGLTGPAPISIAGGSYSIDGGAFTSDPGTVNNGDTVVVQLTSSATFSTPTTATLTIDGSSADFIATTLAADTTPDAFSFTPKTDVALSATVDSNSVAITGINGPTPISIVGGSYSINGGAFTTAPGTINNNDTVIVEVAASPFPTTPTTATLTVGTVTADFMATTIAADITPDVFTFTPKTDVPLSTLVSSNSITVTGIDSQAPISVTGGLYSINGGTFTSTPGIVHLGETVVVGINSSALPLTASTATLTIGTVGSDFAVTTLNADIAPDQFSFTPKTGVALGSTVDSDPITITGITAPSPISIVGGFYSINGSVFSSTPGTVSNGDTVVVEQTASASSATTTTATLTIGGVTADFNVTTLVVNGNVAPVLQPIPAQNVVVNNVLTFTVQASDANGDTLTFSLGSNAPSGASIDPSTGVFTWTPTTLGTFTFDVNVTDGTFTVSQPVTVSVTTTPQPAVQRRGGGDNGNHCGSQICKDFREYRNKYKNESSRQAYFTVKDLSRNNIEEFKRLRGVYYTYKDFSKNERLTLSPQVQQDFSLYHKYNGYKHYRSLQERVN